MAKSLNLVAEFASDEAMAEALRDLADELVGNSKHWRRAGVYACEQLYDQCGCWAHVLIASKQLTKREMLSAASHIADRRRDLEEVPSPVVFHRTGEWPKPVDDMTVRELQKYLATGAV